MRDEGESLLKREMREMREERPDWNRTLQALDQGMSAVAGKVAEMSMYHSFPSTWMSPNQVSPHQVSPH